MRKIIDWLFMDDDQWFNKYVLPLRLGETPYRGMRIQSTARGWTTRPSPAKRLLFWIFG